MATDGSLPEGHTTGCADAGGSALAPARHDVYTPTMSALGDAVRARFAEQLDHGDGRGGHDDKAHVFGSIVLDRRCGAGERAETVGDRP